MITVEEVKVWESSGRHGGGKHVKRFVARLGDVTCEAHTAAAAKRSLLEALAVWHSAEPHRPIVIEHCSVVGVVGKRPLRSVSAEVPFVVEWEVSILGESYPTAFRSDATAAMLLLHERIARQVWERTGDPHLAAGIIATDPDALRRLERIADYQVRHDALVAGGFDGDLHGLAGRGPLTTWPDGIPEPDPIRLGRAA